MKHAAFWLLVGAAVAGCLSISGRQRAQRARRTQDAGDAAFFESAIALNQAILLVSSAAMASARADAVRALARRMTREHALLGRRFKHASGFPAPTGMDDADARRVLEQIATGEEVDSGRAYLAYLQGAHDQLTLLCNRRHDSEDARAVGREALAMLGEHREMVESVYAELPDRLPVPRAQAGFSATAH